MPATALIVALSGRARRDLGEIEEWIARDDPVRALTFVRELRAVIADLSMRHGLYPVIAGSRRAPVHRMNYQGYRILYRVSPGRVDVLAVHHGARALPDIRS